MKIASNIEMGINYPGNKVFSEISNPFGDFEPQYDLQEGSELLLGQATDESKSDSNYKVTFVDMSNGKFGYQLEKMAALFRSMTIRQLTASNMKASIFS